MRSRDPHLSGLHNYPGWVTRLGGVNFPQVKPLGGVAAITVANRHTPGPKMSPAEKVVTAERKWLTWDLLMHGVSS